MATPHSIEQIDRWFACVHFTPECWEWLGSRHPSGHGQFTIGGRTIGAHRVAYLWFVGDVPHGLDLDHLCRQPWCVNPKHLEPVTGGENLRRALVARTHCRRGHPFCEGNLILVTRNGKVERSCRECHRNAMVKINAKWNPLRRKAQREI